MHPARRPARDDGAVLRDGAGVKRAVGVMSNSDNIEKTVGHYALHPYPCNGVETGAQRRIQFPVQRVHFLVGCARRAGRGVAG
jgi:hypothetical protein